MQKEGKNGKKHKQTTKQKPHTQKKIFWIKKVVGFIIWAV